MSERNLDERVAVLEHAAALGRLDARVHQVDERLAPGR